VSPASSNECGSPDIATLREVVASGTPSLRREAIALCRLAYDEDLTELFESVGPSVHVTIHEGDLLVSHAMWCTRWLQIDRDPPLRTAYVEAVATHPAHRKRGLASRVMRRLIAEIPNDFAVTALSPAIIPFYERLGWRPWQGPLSLRMPDGSLVPTPEELVMIQELPGRPPIDLRRPLSIEWRVGEVW
jgi:aminoglycoside 2'-N-acetyltransferase I